MAKKAPAYFEKSTAKGELKMSVENVSAPYLTMIPAKGDTPKPEMSTAPTTKEPVAMQLKPDVVELSGRALAKSLKLAGQNPQAIALKMGLDINTVNNYLNVKVATSAGTTPAVPKEKQSQLDAATTAVTEQSSPSEEATEPVTEKTSETAQGKK